MTFPQGPMYAPLPAPPPVPAPKRPSVLGTLGLLVGLAVGGALTYAGAVEIRTELSLRDGAATVMATVTDTRIMRSTRMGDSFEVLYRFQLPGSPTAYTHTDATGREGLWAAVPEVDWQAARQAKLVAVSYLPADPWNNRPAKAADSPLGDPIAGLGLGLVFLVPCLLLLVSRLRRAFA